VRGRFWAIIFSSSALNVNINGR